MARRPPGPVPGFSQLLNRGAFQLERGEKAYALRQAGAVLEEYLRRLGQESYNGIPSDHTHTGSGSGGTIDPSTYEDAEAMGMISWMRATE